jgi:glutamate-1-semialdehyde 2,1-aminomutase
MNRETSAALYERALACIPGGVNSPVRAFKKVGGVPIYFATAKGKGFVDADGNEYVDFCQSWGPLVLGHAHPQVVAAVVDAAPRGLSYGATHAAEIDLARLILDGFAHAGFDRVRAVSSGTEAVMTALRVARGKTGRDLVLKFDGGYHGHFDGMLVKAGSGLATLAIADSSGVPAGVAATTLVADFDDERAVERIFDRHGADIAAVILEPLPANNGLLLQRDEYLRFLRDITARHGTLLIFDEVISGFRLHFGGYGELAGVAPDLVTLGKIVGGGMPIGAVVGRAETMDLLAPLGSVYQAGTLSGNPVSLAAGIATLTVLRDEPPYDRLEALGARFEARLAAAGLPAVRVVRRGSVLWPYFGDGPLPTRAADVSPLTVARFNTIYGALLDQGLYLPPSAMEVLFLCAAHDEGDVDRLADALIAAAATW